MLNQATPVKVALLNQATPVKVVPSNMASPVKVDRPKRAMPVKVALLNRATPVKVAPMNMASATTPLVRSKSMRVAPVRSRRMPGQKRVLGDRLRAHLWPGRRADARREYVAR